jgi:hypothetical protein
LQQVVPGYRRISPLYLASSFCQSAEDLLIGQGLTQRFHDLALR